MNRQRLVIYAERHRVLEGANLEDQVRSFLDEAVAAPITAATADGYPEEWDLEQLWTELRTLYPIGVTVEQLEERSGGGRAGLSRDYLIEEIQEDVQQAYDRRQEELGEEVTRELERRVILSVLDRKWARTPLRNGLPARRYRASRDGPEGSARRVSEGGLRPFQGMMDAIKEESVGYLFHVDVSVGEAGELEGGVEGAIDDPEEAELEAALTENSQGLKVTAPGLAPARAPVLEYSAPSEEVDGSVTKVAAVNPDGGEGALEYAGTPKNAPVSVRFRPKVQALPRSRQLGRRTGSPTRPGSPLGIYLRHFGGLAPWFSAGVVARPGRRSGGCWVLFFQRRRLAVEVTLASQPPELAKSIGTCLILNALGDSIEPQMSR